MVLSKAILTYLTNYPILFLLIYLIASILFSNDHTLLTRPYHCGLPTVQPFLYSLLISPACQCPHIKSVPQEGEGVKYRIARIIRGPHIRSLSLNCNLPE